MNRIDINDVLSGGCTEKFVLLASVVVILVIEYGWVLAYFGGNKSTEVPF